MKPNKTVHCFYLIFLMLAHKAVGESQIAKEHVLCLLDICGIWFACDELKAMCFQDGILPSPVWSHIIIMQNGSFIRTPTYKYGSKASIESVEAGITGFK